MKKLISLSLIVLLLSGCEDGMRSAELMSLAADECVLAVRDKKQTYTDAPPCKEIKTHAYRYLDESRAAWWKSTKAETVFESARARAWMAAALNNAFQKDSPRFSIW